jgi:mRNA-degrading endonuclease toxin of MazEF toxin-antitoxin module
VEDGGVREESFAMTDQVRAVSRDRLVGDPWGRVSPGVIAAIEERLRLLLGLA